MVYNEGTAGVDRVRYFSGNLIPEDTPNTEIAHNIELAYSEVCLISHRALNDPYPDTAVEKNYCSMLECLIAAMLTLKPMGPEFESKITELKSEIIHAEELFGVHAVIPETPDETAEAEALIIHTKYKSSGLNCQVRPPNRLKGCGSHGGIEGQNYDHFT
jgi:hypothetical protein